MELANEQSATAARVCAQFCVKFWKVLCCEELRTCCVQTRRRRRRNSKEIPKAKYTERICRLWPCPSIQLAAAWALFLLQSARRKVPFTTSATCPRFACCGRLLLVASNCLGCKGSFKGEVTCSGRSKGTLVAPFAISMAGNLGCFFITEYGGAPNVSLGQN